MLIKLFKSIYSIDIDLLKAIIRGPGSRGGKFWIDRGGTVRYGDRPVGTRKKKVDDKNKNAQAKKVFDLYLKNKQALTNKEAKEAKKQNSKAKKPVIPESRTTDKENLTVGLKKEVVRAKKEPTTKDQKLSTKVAEKETKVDNQEPMKQGGKPGEGFDTKAFGNDPRNVYEFKYQVTELDDLVTSNKDNGEIDPKYSQELQPRSRNRAASLEQIDSIARNLSPEALLLDFHTIDKGVPIAGEDLMVESGNGRTMALRKAQKAYPESWQRYQNELIKQAKHYGIPEADIKKFKNPVLVRVRTSKVDRAEFAREANEPPVLQMSPLEKAGADSKRLTPEMLTRFQVGEDQSIDQALRAAANRAFVRQIISTMPKNEQATLIRKDGTLARMGIWRIKAAIFSKVFPGVHGERLAETFFESIDGSIKNFENAISAVLPKIAVAESMIQSGKRPSEMSIISDITKVIDVFARLKENGVKIPDYVKQIGMFKEDELTDVQKKMLLKFDEISRSPKQIREWFEKYADFVIKAPDPKQAGMFDIDEGGRQATKEDLLAILTKSQISESDQPADNSGKLDLPLLRRKKIDWSQVPEESLLWALFHHKIGHHEINS